jgi:hypothetical protein
VQAITAAIVSILGELVGNYVRARRGLRRRSRTHAHTLQSVGVAAAGVYGLLISGPVMHWWYGFVDKVFGGNSAVGRSLTRESQVRIEWLMIYASCCSLVGIE